MSVQKAIYIAKKTIKKDEQFVEEIREEERKNPDTSKEQLSASIHRIVIKLAENEIQTLQKIISELHLKQKKRTKKIV